MFARIALLVLRHLIRGNVEHKPAAQTSKNLELAVEAAAIHRATDVINKRIERGDFNDYDEVREAVLVEFAFQKIAIHEAL